MPLFAFFGLWSTTLLAGIGAVSVPIIIHLLNRKRYRIVTWAAMRFLLMAQKQNSRRLRLEQLLLLLVRCTIVALVVFAMAAVMPWAETVWAMLWPEGAGGLPRRGQRMHHVLVLDASLSMQLGGEGRSLFDQARKLALLRVQDAQPGDGFSVLLMKDTPTWIVGEASQDHRRVQREIEALRGSHGNAGVATMLTMVAAKLTEAQGRFPGQAVYFFTDLQKATWLTGAAQTPAPPLLGNKEPLSKAGIEGIAKEHQIYQDIQDRAKTVFVDVGREDVPNLAVLGLKIDLPFLTTGQEVPIQFAVKNFSKERKTNIKVDLLVARSREAAGDSPLNLRVGETKTLAALEPGEIKQAAILFRFPVPGTYVLQVKVEGGDELDLDDARSLVVTVKDTIPVLLVNGKPSADRFARATEYLHLALNPFPAGAEPKFAPLRPKTVNAAQFTDMNEAELAGYDCIYFCDLGNLGGGDLRRLETHLRRGGGAVFALGDNAADNLEVYNRLLFKSEQGLLPAQLIKKVAAAAEHHFYLHAADENFSEPPLKAFADDDDKLSLRIGRFQKHVQAKVVSDAKVRTILSFMPELMPGSKAELDKSLPIGDPALVEWNPPLPRVQAPAAADKARRLPPARYRGKVVLFTSTVNMDWNSWPGSPSFGALMQELTRLAVSGRLREQATVVGGLLEEFLPDPTEADATVYYPPNLTGLKPQKTRTQLIDDVTLFRWTDTDYSGVYKMTLGGTSLEVPFAVNFPATTPDQRGSECDLSKADKSQLQEMFPGWDVQIVGDARQARVSGGPVQEEAAPERAPVGPTLAHVALVIVLALILLEVILAWQFGHYSAVEGQTAGAASGLGWPIAVAGLAAVLFAAGAFVLIHAAKTGDFLGFLSEGLRSHVETSLGLPPAPPGESSRWELDNRPFLWDGANEAWIAGALAVAALVLLVFIYRAEAPTAHPVYKLLLGALRFFLILLTLTVLLPQLKLQFDRQGWPDVVVLLDTSRSMGEADVFQDDKVKERVKDLSEQIKKNLQDTLPGKIASAQGELLDLRTRAEKNPELTADIDKLAGRIAVWQNQLNQMNSTSWRPTRLQLAQALLDQPGQDWLRALLTKRRMKVHVYALDGDGRAAKLADPQGPAGEITDPADPKQLERTKRAIAALEPEGNESRLGTALRQVIDHYRGSSLAAVIMVTDGVTTRDETIAQVGDYAAQKAVPLFFVGIGDDHEIRDLKLHDLQVEDVVYVNDKVIFEARLTGQGYKDLTVPVLLKVKEKDGKEKELAREMVKVDPQGRAVKVRLRFQPKEVGRKLFIVEVEAPKSDRPDKAPNPAHLRLERMIEVIDAKLIKVLYVEGQPRYEYRYIKALLEREDPREKRNRIIDLKVLLLEADANFPGDDRNALADFPTREELDAYDVILFGDCDPHHPKLGEARLRHLAEFVRGEDRKGKKTGKTGGGLLFMAGPFHNPHAYRDSPLADVMPIEPGKPPDDAATRNERLRLDLTPVGRMHPIFRFSPDEAENLNLWQRLAPMFWHSSGYRLKPLAEVLAVHPTLKAEFKEPGQDPRHPLVVQQFVGSGRTMFFGFEESWRWRFREDEIRFNQFWIQTVRYLSRSRLTRTDLRLDRQTPYRLGEPIKVTVRFPETGPDGSGRLDPKMDVKVTVEYRSTKKDGPGESEVQTLQLAKLEGSWATYEALLARTREGKYRFRLTTPDVSKSQPDGEKPSAEATVDLPPGELDRLRLNEPEMSQAADATQGKYYPLVGADQVLEDVPAGFRISVGIQPGGTTSGAGGGGGGGMGQVIGKSSLAPTGPGVLLWNHWLCFTLFLLLVSAEWFLRKRKHLL